MAALDMADNRTRRAMCFLAAFVVHGVAVMSPLNDLWGRFLGYFP